MLKILIVDDSLIIRNNLKKMMEDLGHEVVGMANSGEEAISIYSKQKPDLVTMDITMPLMNGIEALKFIKEKYDEDANIIMITSHGEENLVIDAIKAGAKGYILKPITHGKILKAIERVFPALESEEA